MRGSEESDHAPGAGVLSGRERREARDERRARTAFGTGTGKFRWHNDYRFPSSAGDGTTTVRLHANDDDVRRRFNRTENIRPIPAADPDFDALYRRRNDAESINRALDDTLWLRRAHSVGHARQHLILLTFALGVNSLAAHRHHGRPIRRAA